MSQIEVTLSMCTLYKGVPHGLAAIQYEDPDDDELSFKGVCVFNHGQLHNTPFMCLRGDGLGFSFSNIQNGRPADASYHTEFDKDGVTQYVDSKETETDVSGWQNYSGQVDKERRYNGLGKMWYTDGDIYIGQWKNDNFSGGKEYELQQDGTHTLYNVKYEERREIERKEISKGHKLV